MDTSDAVARLATLVAEIAHCTRDLLGSDRARQINACCFEIVSPMGFHDDAAARQGGAEGDSVPNGDNLCGDLCPTDTTERCVRSTGHSGPWHEGERLRWRRE